jgi:hypothetical protein
LAGQVGSGGGPEGAQLRPPHSRVECFALVRDGVDVDHHSYSRIDDVRSTEHRDLDVCEVCVVPRVASLEVVFMRCPRVILHDPSCPARRQVELKVRRDPILVQSVTVLSPLLIGASLPGVPGLNEGG